MKLSFVGVLLAGLVLAVPGQAQFSTNLVVNGDAETGGPGPTGNVAVAVSGWITTSNFTIHRYGDPNWLTTSDPGPVNRGSNFFYGGPISSFSTATQTIDLSWATPWISLGNTPFNFSAWMGGWQTQNDNMSVTAQFLSSANSVLGTVQLGPIFAAERSSQRGLLLRSSTGFLPTLTTQVSIKMAATRLVGSDNDGYADNIDFRILTPVPEPSTFAMLGAALAGLGLTLRRRRTGSAN